MICNECGYKNQPKRKYCSSCGSKLKLICNSCGANNEAEDKYCGECGIALNIELDLTTINKDEIKIKNPQTRNPQNSENLLMESGEASQFCLRMQKALLQCLKN